MKKSLGYFYNADVTDTDNDIFPLTSITSITATFSGTAPTLYLGTSANPSTNSQTLVNGVTVTVSGTNFFKVAASSSGVCYLTSLVITYSCVAVTPVLQSVSIADSNTSYAIGTTYSTANGLTVTGVYNTGSHIITSGYTINGSGFTPESAFTTAGTYSVTVTYEAIVSNSIDVVVYDPSIPINPTSITISQSALALEVGESEILTYSLTPSNASTTVTWSSDNSAVATVSDGTITALAAGSATITVATANNYSSDCSVTVLNPQSVTKTNIASTYTDYIDNNVYTLDNCPTIGNPKLLIIPIWFNDSSTYITNDTNKANVHSDIASVYLGTVSDTGWNSVASFYDTESNGNVNLTGTVSDWYNSGVASTSVTATDDTTSLVTSASNWFFTQNPSENRTDYDTDGDGYLDGIMLIYAAPDYSSANSSNDNLWAYCYWMQDSNVNSVTNPGANVFFWASYDFMYDSSTSLARSGTSYGGGDCTNCTLDAHTYIHEMGHVFGLEDYYDYSGQYTPAGGFSMQDYNVGGHDPYSVMAYGWSDPYIPTQSCQITISAFQTSRDLILLTPSWNSYDSPFDEYLLLELYTPTGLNEFDSIYRYSTYYPQGPTTTGIRLWHVDARLAYYNKGWSSSQITTNPNYSYPVYHAMSNTYYSSSTASYCSVLGSGYYNYNILQLIRNNTSATYTPTDYFDNTDLFTNGSSFSMPTFSGQFVNGNNLNSGTALGWSFSVSISGSGASATATITLAKN